MDLIFNWIFAFIILLHINQFTGGGNSGGTGGGGFNIGDIISQVTQGAQKNQGEQANSGGGLMDLIKGFMK